VDEAVTYEVEVDETINLSGRLWGSEKEIKEKHPEEVYGEIFSRVLGEEIKSAQWVEINLSKEVEEDALKQLSLAPDEDLIVLSIGAEYPHLVWGIPKWIELMTILDRYRVCLLRGGRWMDREGYTIPVEVLGLAHIKDLRLEYNLNSIIAILKRAKLVVGEDAGIVHLAGLLGRPVILLTPCIERMREIKRSVSRLIEGEKDRAGCNFCFGREDCPINEYCVSEIDTEKVLKAISDMEVELK